MQRGRWRRICRPATVCHLLLRHALLPRRPLPASVSPLPLNCPRSGPEYQAEVGLLSRYILVQASCPLRLFLSMPIWVL